MGGRTGMAGDPQAEALRRRRISETQRRKSGRTAEDEQPKPCACGCGELTSVMANTGKARMWRMGHDHRRQIDEQGRLRCCRCQEFKPLSEFGALKSALHGVRSNCRPCEAEKFREWRDRNPDKDLNTLLRRKFGITVEQYRVMLAEQGGICAICGEPPTDDNSGRWVKQRRGTRAKPRLIVDHDHVTGQVRGLLCGRCNTGIGMLQDDPIIVRFALKYLEGHS